MYSIRRGDRVQTTAEMYSATSGQLIRVGTRGVIKDVRDDSDGRKFLVQFEAWAQPKQVTGDQIERRA